MLTEETIKEIMKLLVPMKKELTYIQNEVIDLQLVLENETNRNIKLIAEEHLDLSNKLDKVLTVENEIELLLVRIIKIENDIRKIKSEIEKIA